ncbi:MAG TPA: sulfotransferase [Steroidobacteraceae bacterium]|nr:sulfotransferase [Steroidobacteraceae bacterium]
MDAQLQFFANAKRLSGASIYLDGTKSIRRAQLFARDGRVEMRALHLIRDGRGFCSSYLGHTASQNPPVSDSAKAWLRYIAQVDRFASAFPSVPIMMVKYEDLCRSTEQTIRLICNFMEIPYENRRPSTMDDVHILGNRMRRDFRGTIVEDTSWKEKLDPRTQRVLTSLMKRQLARFGYL